MRRLRLVRLVDPADFRSSEETNFVNLVSRFPEVAKLGKDEVVLFVSAKGDQVVFVYGFHGVERGTERYMTLRSERLRLCNFRGPVVAGRTPAKSERQRQWKWDPLMLTEYAAQVGIELVGLARWEKHKKALIKGLVDSFSEPIHANKKKTRADA
jgi:hypothetical protein